MPAVKAASNRRTRPDPYAYGLGEPAPDDAGGARFTDQQVLLTLALASYRAFHDLRPGWQSRIRLRHAVAKSLVNLAPLRGRWEPAWGPSSYRAPFTLFDDNVAFVVRSRLDPSCYVVVVRGTNPVSAFDWLFGDFWVGRTVPWPYGDSAGRAGARISLSTAFGLSALRHLRSAGPRPGPVGAVHRFLEEDLGDTVRSALGTVIRPLEGPLVLTVRRVRAGLRAEKRRIARLGRALSAEGFEARLARYVADRASASRRRLLRRIDRVGDVLDDPALHLLRIMQGSISLRGKLAQGTTLIGFLRNEVAAAPDGVRVIVTGHSKGGALAPALALMLADTQGDEVWVADRDRWDPDRRAEVACFSFAGPTPGNGAFAARFADVLGATSHRVVNRLDVVPHAWAVRGRRRAAGLFIDDVLDLYGAGVNRLDVLEELLEAIVADTAELDYRHVGGRLTVLDPGVDPDRTLFFEQAVYQHMGAYIDALGLGEDVDERDFLTPLS